MKNADKKVRSGIAVAGNLIVDQIKMIDSYPESGMLVNIMETGKNIGGLAGNTSVSLKRLAPELDVFAIGKTGNDEQGVFIKSVLKENGVNISGISTANNIPSSFTDVMTDMRNGHRTFFHMRGANAKFGFSDIDFDSITAKYFHIGYALLLDSFDAADSEYGTVMARALHTAQSMGMKTSMDVVSENSDRFKKIVTPSIKYCDNIIINEIEGQMVAGIPARDKDGKINPDNIKKICQSFFDAGCKDNVVIHAPEAGFWLNSKGQFFVMPSLALPKGYIKGTVGAGDAFCAGILYSLYNGLSETDGLKLASCAAACNLSKEDSIGGMCSAEKALELDKQFKRQTV